ncbi:MAG: T9SS type A sorting domain-containing protein [Bacteroidia bacterium]|nr:T9SS type A sorting domain-containing protein [Bacteroidia bacterium]
MFDIEYVIKNNGSAATSLTDSIIVLYILNSNQVLTVSGQSPVFYTNRVLNVNDTIWGKFKLILNITAGDITVPFCVRAFAQTNNQTIDPNQTNNTSCNNVLLPVNEVTKALQSLEVYPNPSSSVLNIALDYKFAKLITVLDLSGRIVEQINIIDKNTQINVSNLNTGIYLYRIIDTEGTVIKSGKFNVSR